MRHPLSALAALCFMLAPVALQVPMAHAAGAVPAATPTVSPTARVIVKYKASGSLMRALAAGSTSEAGGTVRAPQHAAALSSRHGMAMTDGAAVSAQSQVVFAQGMTSAKLAEELAKDSDVEYAEPDLPRRAQAAPNDPLYPGNLTTATPATGQWYLRPPTATNVSAINAEAAWNTTAGSNSIVVAVLDTGIRFDHPDLAGKTYLGYDFVNVVGISNDNDGRDADASDPGDYVTDTEVNDPASPLYHCTTPDPTTGIYVGEDSSWHGTQVAGLVGANTDNAVGMASVGRAAMILPVRVLGRCIGYDSDIQAGMLWAAGIAVPGVPANAHPAQVINLSLGGGTTCTQNYKNVIAQVAATGTVVVASAGNDGLAVSAPADCPGVIAVGGLRHVGTKVGYSSLGPEIAVSAPAGNCVNSSGSCMNPLITTTNSGLTTPATNTYSDGFNPSLGTSFASPLVAGTVGLMLSVHPTLTASQIRSILQATARTFPTTSATATAICHAPTSTAQDTECICTTSTCGAGMLNAAGAVATAVDPAITLTSSASSVSAGASVTLDASGTTVSAGRSIGSYQWSISSGGSAATLSATSGPSVTLLTSGAGSVVVALTVADNATGQSTTTTTVTVNAVSTGGGGGGGALNPIWLMALLAAVFAVRRARQDGR